MHTFLLDSYISDFPSYLLYNTSHQENLLLESDREDSIIKIADFGLANVTDSNSSNEVMRTACGTPGYVAPEVLYGTGYGPKVDVWSLGIILYILLCGFPPFYDEDNRALFETIKTGSYEYPSPWWDGISASAKDLIDHMLVVDPEARYSADDVLGHPFINAVDPNKDHSIVEALGELSRFNARRKFRAVIKIQIVTGRMRKMMEMRRADTAVAAATTATVAK